MPHEALAAERRDKCEMPLKGRLRATLLPLNEGMMEKQAERVAYVDATL